MRIGSVILIIVLAAVCVIQYCMIKNSKKKRRMIEHDKLTGVCNWEHLQQKAAALEKSDRRRFVICSNIADFKLINELFGRETGDLILKKQAQNMMEHASESCLYGRVGDDHFVLMVDADEFDEKNLYICRDAMQAILEESLYTIQVYFGIYESKDGSESLSSMCDKAILALESIKGSAQTFVAYYDDSMLQDAILRKKVVDEFDDALANNEFKMYLQPQISARTGKLSGSEALVRKVRAEER